MGRIGAPFGVKGWVRVQPYTKRRNGLLAYPEWWIAGPEGWQTYAVAEAAEHGSALVARLAGCDDRDAAAALRNREIGIPRARLPEVPGEHYWADLLGLEVINARGVSLGRVVRLMDTGANAILVVCDEKERLIPFVERVVLAVEPDAGNIVVDWERDY
jgi:16S rRNA processing protein RimM